LHYGLHLRRVSGGFCGSEAQQKLSFSLEKSAFNASTSTFQRLFFWDGVRVQVGPPTFLWRRFLSIGIC
jgi:hypothetical protein